MVHSLIYCLSVVMLLRHHKKQRYFGETATLFVIESDRELDTDRIKRIAILAVFWPVSLSLATLYALIKR